MVTANVDKNSGGQMNEALNMVAQFDITDMERFLVQVGRLIAAKKAPVLSKRETELMLTINYKYPEEVWNRYHAIKDRMNEGTMTKTEHEELLQMTTKFEEWNFVWLKALIELANLKKMTLDELMEKLEINQTYR